MLVLSVSIPRIGLKPFLMSLLFFWNKSIFIGVCVVLLAMHFSLKDVEYSVELILERWASSSVVKTFFSSAIRLLQNKLECLSLESFSRPVKYLRVRLEPIELMLTHSVVRLPAWLANIWLDWKNFTEKNPLAYFAAAAVPRKKKFYSVCTRFTAGSDNLRPTKKKFLNVCF